MLVLPRANNLWVGCYIFQLVLIHVRMGSMSKYSFAMFLSLFSVYSIYVLQVKYAVPLQTLHRTGVSFLKPAKAQLSW